MKYFEGDKGWGDAESKPVHHLVYRFIAVHQRFFEGQNSSAVVTFCVKKQASLSTVKVSLTKLRILHG